MMIAGRMTEIEIGKGGRITTKDRVLVCFRQMSRIGLLGLCCFEQLVLSDSTNKHLFGVASNRFIIFVYYHRII